MLYSCFFYFQTTVSKLENELCGYFRARCAKSQIVSLVYFLVVTLSCPLMMTLVHSPGPDHHYHRHHYLYLNREDQIQHCNVLITTRKKQYKKELSEKEILHIKRYNQMTVHTKRTSIQHLKSAGQYGTIAASFVSIMWVG